VKHTNIINDEKFGLKTIASVAIWMEAIELGAESIPYKKLMEVHGLTAEMMINLVGPTSFMKALFFVAQNNIAMKYNCKKVCDNTIMFAIQWANQALTNDDSTFTSLNVKKVNSLYDLDSSLFGARPEYSYYVSTMKGVTPVPLNVG